ncbi:kinase-like domain-containing protein [Mycena rebaudengoi]|nr:kinase-like domain-containing protein [Mycena rebaudengoi]
MSVALTEKDRAPETDSTTPLEPSRPGPPSSHSMSASKCPVNPAISPSRRTEKIFIQQSLFSFLEGSSSRLNPRMNTVLCGHYETMSAEDSISALVKSRESRTVLLKMTQALETLREDEGRIATHILSILESKSSQTVLKLTGDPAQHFLDVVQNALDRGFLLESEHNSKARRIILRISEACDELPLDAELRRMRLKFCREALIWQHLRHPYILPMIGIDRNSFSPSLCMVSPWMENGTVLRYLEDHKGANVDRLLSEIAQGLEYLHSRNIVHGDLRGANILINDKWSACSTDFGLTSLSDATTATNSSNRAGSVRWMAPELLAPDRFGHHKFSRTPASDVYAFGCVCLELYTGRSPFADISETAAMFKVINGERPFKPSCDPPILEALWHSIAIDVNKCSSSSNTAALRVILGSRYGNDSSAERLAMEAI